MSPNTTTADRTPANKTGMPILLDVRTRAEYAQGHVDGAINMDMYQPTIVHQLDALDRDGDYVVYCRSGNRSAQVVAYMRQAGFANVRDMSTVAATAGTLNLPVVY